MTDDNSIDDPDFEMDFDDGDPFEDFESGGDLGDTFRRSPLAKALIVGGGFLAIVGAIVLFGGEPEVVSSSRVPRPAEVKDTPGEETSEAYEAALTEENTARAEEAIKQGASVIPVPVSNPDLGRIPMPEEEVQEEDPLERWRRVQQQRAIEAQKAAAAVPVRPQANQGPKGPTQTEIVNEMAAAMATQMQSILSQKKKYSTSHMSVSPPDYLEQQRELEKQKALEEAEMAAQAAKNASSQGQQQFGPNVTASENEVEIINIIIPQGEIEYAQLLMEANSDLPGPIVAQLAGGRLSGSKLIGSFSEQNDYLILKFNTVVVDGVGQSVNAIAIDPDTTLTGMATDIDRRYFTRIILPAAANFVEGMGEAIAETGKTTVTVDQGAAVSQEDELNTREQIFAGISDAASEISELFEEEGRQTKPLIRVAAGTPMGILFLEPVTEEDR